METQSEVTIMAKAAIWIMFKAAIAICLITLSIELIKFLFRKLR